MRKKRIIELETQSSKGQVTEYRKKGEKVQEIKESEVNKIDL